VRKQLAASIVYHWNGAESDFNAGQLLVPNHIPRLVPGNYRFPVIGQFTAFGDLTFTIQFFVDDGYLGSVHIESTDDWTDEQQLRWDSICERSEEHTSELQSRFDLVCRLLLEKKNSTAQPRRPH